MSVDPLAATVAAPSPTLDLAPGDLVAQRYKVEAILGRGAMGVVYRVEHLYMRKRFALKVLNGAWARTPGAFARFEREAIATGHISAPHVAHATDFGSLPDGSCFLVLEYIDGQTLRRAVERGALKPRRALGIARGIVSAIEAAHAAGVIHRDLKPENIMLLDRDGNPDYVKVLDFGLAALEPSALAGASAQSLTQHGALMGTPYYMAPEQATGERIDPRTDLYALGVILYEMLVGDCPFRGDGVSVIRQHVLQEAPALPPSVLAEAGERVAGIVRRLLMKKPEERFGSAHELALALDECLAAYTTSKFAPPVASVLAQVVVPADPSPAAPPIDANGKPAPLSQAYRRAVASMVGWRDAAVDVVRARRRRRRIQAVFAWPGAVFGRLGGWTKRGRGSIRTAWTTVASRLRKSHLPKGTARNLGLIGAMVAAVTVALVLFAVGWRYLHTATASSSNAAASSSSVSGATPSTRAPVASPPTAKSAQKRR